LAGKDKDLHFGPDWVNLWNMWVSERFQRLCHLVSVCGKHADRAHGKVLSLWSCFDGRKSRLETTSLQQDADELYTSPKERRHYSPRENWIRLERKAAKVFILEFAVSVPRAGSVSSTSYLAVLVFNV